MGTQFSDLPFRPGHEKVIVLQPHIASTLKDTTDFSQYVLNKGGFYAQALSEIVEKRRLTHVASFTCYNYQDNPGEVSIAGPDCGGIVSVQPIWRSITPDWMVDREYKTKLVCSNRNCNMFLGSWLSMEEWANVFFHLALKQMVPGLPMLNYTHCAAKEEGHTEQQRKDLKKIRSFGTVSIASQVTCGTFKNGFFDEFEQEYSIGFILVPGMDTRKGCYGFDQWLQLLIQEKFKRLKDEHNQKVAWLIGPKSVSGYKPDRK